MGGKSIIPGQNIIDPLGAMFVRSVTSSIKGDPKKNKPKTNVPSEADRAKAELYKMMQDRQMRISRELESTSAYSNQNNVQQPVGLPVALPEQPVAQPVTQPVTQPVSQVDQKATNAILNPTPTITPATVSSVAAPSVFSPVAPLSNQATGMGQQKVNQFSMPSASGLKFGGT